MDASHLELSHSVSVYWYVMHLLKSSPNLLHEVCKDVDIDILSHLLEDEPVSHAQLCTADGNMLLLKRYIMQMSCWDYIYRLPQQTSAVFFSMLKCHITPLKKTLGFRVRSVLKNSGIFLSDGH